MELNFYVDPGKFGVVEPMFICKVENAKYYPQKGEIIEFQDSYGDKLKEIKRKKSLEIFQIKHCIHPEKGMIVNIYCH